MNVVLGGKDVVRMRQPFERAGIVFSQRGTHNEADSPRYSSFMRRQFFSTQVLASQAIRTIALVGQHAPGTPPGVTFSHLEAVSRSLTTPVKWSFEAY